MRCEDPYGMRGTCACAALPYAKRMPLLRCSKRAIRRSRELSERHSRRCGELLRGSQCGSRGRRTDRRVRGSPGCYSRTRRGAIHPSSRRRHRCIFSMLVPHPDVVAGELVRLAAIASKDASASRELSTFVGVRNRCAGACLSRNDEGESLLARANSRSVTPVG